MKLVKDIVRVQVSERLSDYVHREVRKSKLSDLLSDSYTSLETSL